MTPREILALCREREIRAVDLRYCDLLGAWRRVTIPVGKLGEELFEDGLALEPPSFDDRPSARDVLLVPDPETAYVDPFPAEPTLALICGAQDPITRDDHPFDPRNVARQAAAYLQGSGVADECRLAPGPEFHIFDEVAYDPNNHDAYDHVESSQIRYPKYEVRNLPAAADLRTEMMRTMVECGIEVEAHRRDGERSRVDLRHAPLVQVADWTTMAKAIVKNVALRHGKSATFMPMPVVGGFGSGMRIQFSLWKNGQPLFAGGAYAGLSDVGLWAIGGILRHAAALAAFTNPTTNSYKRLVPGPKTPVLLAYSQSNGSTAVRVPMDSARPKSKRIEFRTPDPSCNPYLAFSATLMAAIDGVQNKFNPGRPLDEDLAELSPEALQAVAKTPASLDESLKSLEKDRDFLLRGDVFPEGLLDAWIASKRKNEVEAIRSRPHPYEFELYYDA